jgi:hypothetical protein
VSVTFVGVVAIPRAAGGVVVGTSGVVVVMSIIGVVVVMMLPAPGGGMGPTPAPAFTLPLAAPSLFVCALLFT